jgi:hypothetical protein
VEYVHLQNINELVSKDSDVGTGDSGPVTLQAVKDANHTLYIQRIIISIVTYAAKTFTLQDSAGTPVVIGSGSIPATAPTAAGKQTYEYDFGPRGTALTQGKSLVLALSASGAAARVHVEGYQRKTGVTYA